ncbi:MAG TPA: TrkH family potassium uptake protein [Clostridiales bacterium]|nr:TrkH family potassium uptake protein [Clostridiales bacterium]
MNIFKFNTVKDGEEKLTHFSPTKALVFGFAFLILAGAILLSLPVSTKPGYSVGFLDAVFTATSAVCVTGLVVVDTNTTWSAFGQTVIIILIQIGGLGIMSLATMFSLVLGRRIGLKERLAIQESLNEFTLTGIVRVFKKILYATFAIEFIGAAVLSTRLIPLYGLKSGIAKSVFHSISAFCNAGFDIFGSVGNEFISLTQLNREPVIIITIGLLIIIGGLGFIVWKDVVQNRKFSSFMLHTKIVLIVTTILIVSGSVLFFVFESNNPETLKGLPWADKILNAWFHAVTPRTAGYNSLPIAQMTEPSKLMTIFLMFVGGASGSTAGGIKVTTFSVIIFATLSFIKGEHDVNLLSRKIPDTVLRKSLAIVTLSSALVFATTIILLINKEGTLMEALFEAVSGFGTVGLTTGITPGLKVISKLQLILTMFLGRVGPLSAAMIISFGQGSKILPYKYPEGKISVG